MTMATWTMNQVNEARRLRVKLAIDAETISRESEAVQQFAAAKMAERLIDMGHPLGFELHRGDFAVEWMRDDSTPWQVTGVMCWRPTTNTAELRGGHLDGERYAIRNIGEPLRVPRAAVTPWWSTEETSASAAVTEMVDTYELVGWREDERVWVYEARP